MSIRDDILAGLRASDDCTVGDLTAEQLLDAYRAEVLRGAAVEMDRIAHEYGVFGVGSRLRKLADAAERGGAG
ncbi:hypothetical protein [Streptomyces uncialis]|uniref:hypothetical protein n=1 Tax=Streptomyces uncialis TaxID=1048205 RepID=UPI0033DC9EC7